MRQKTKKLCDTLYYDIHLSVVKLCDTLHYDIRFSLWWSGSNRECLWGLPAHDLTQSHSPAVANSKWPQILCDFINWWVLFPSFESELALQLAWPVEHGESDHESIILKKPWNFTSHSLLE